MQGAFTDAFAEGQRRIVVIGSDCPQVEMEDIRTAWSALETHDLVLGPATDGGYWLIGLNRPRPELFHDMAWSGPEVLRETLRRAEQAGLRFRLLRELEDVDDLESWNRFCSRAGGD